MLCSDGQRIIEANMSKCGGEATWLGCGEGGKEGKKTAELSWCAILTTACEKLMKLLNHYYRNSLLTPFRVEIPL